MYAHSLMHSRFHLPSRFGEQWDVLIIYPSCFSFFPSLCMPSPSSGSQRNVVVHSDHFLFHSMHVRCAFTSFYRTVFVLGCFLLFPPSMLLCIGILCHRGSGSLFCFVNIGVCCVCAFFPWSEMVWSGIGYELTC